MATLPSELAPIILAFQPLMLNRTWEHAVVLLVGAILAPGKRTVSSVLRMPTTRAGVSKLSPGAEPCRVEPTSGRRDPARTPDSAVRSSRSLAVWDRRHHRASLGTKNQRP